MTSLKVVTGSTSPNSCQQTIPTTTPWTWAWGSKGGGVTAHMGSSASKGARAFTISCSPIFLGENRSLSEPSRPPRAAVKEAASLLGEDECQRLEGAFRRVVHPGSPAMRPGSGNHPTTGVMDIKSFRQHALAPLPMMVRQWEPFWLFSLVLAHHSRDSDEMHHCDALCHAADAMVRSMLSPRASMPRRRRCSVGMPTFGAPPARPNRAL